MGIGVIAGFVVAGIVHFLCAVAGVNRGVLRFAAAVSGMAVIMVFYWLDPANVIDAKGDAR
jgi:hypothetical protein